MSHGMRQRIKKLEKNINPIKTLNDLLKTLTSAQLKAFITINDTRSAQNISDSFGWRLEQSLQFIEDLKKAPSPKEYLRLSNEELIAIINAPLYSIEQ